MASNSGPGVGKGPIKPEFDRAAAGDAVPPKTPEATLEYKPPELVPVRSLQGTIYRPLTPIEQSRLRRHEMEGRDKDQGHER